MRNLNLVRMKNIIYFIIVLMFVSCNNKDINFNDPEGIDKKIEFNSWDQHSIHNLRHEIFINGSVYCFSSVFYQIDWAKSEGSKTSQIIIENQDIFNKYAYLIGFCSQGRLKKIDTNEIRKVIEFKLNKFFVGDSILNKILRTQIEDQCFTFIQEIYKSEENIPDQYDYAINKLFKQYREVIFNDRNDVLKITTIQSDFRINFNRGVSDYKKFGQPENI